MMFSSFRRSLFKDRVDAGKQLAAAVRDLQPEHPVVLALPRGGVPIAYEVAKELHAPLDLLHVRKIGCPGHEEFGIGAVVDTGGGAQPLLLMNEDSVRMVKPSADYVQQEMQRQVKEIQRQRAAYLRGKPHLPLAGRTVIVCDDGIATGGTAKVALQALKKLNVAKAVLAVPVGPQDSIDELSRDGYEVRCLQIPAHFNAVGQHYESFPQTSDEEVIKCMDDAQKWASECVGDDARN